MSDQISRDCVAIAVTDEFLPGALVALHSFQQHNSWFEGEFVVIHEGLSEASITVFREIFNQISFRSVGVELRDRIDRLLAFRPELSGQRAQFYSLEVFQLRGFRKVLYCDSDLLFRGEIREVWQLPNPMVGTPDRPTFAGKGRDPNTFALCESQRGMMTNTFNAGFFLVDQTLINSTEYRRLLERLDPEHWQAVTAAHTDQLVLNHHFSGRQHLISGSYNFLLSRAPLIESRTGISVSAAKVLHFNLRAKPWRAQRLIRLDSHPRNPSYLMALRLWNEAFVRCLQTRLLRNAVRPE